MQLKPNLPLEDILNTIIKRSDLYEVVGMSPSHLMRLEKRGEFPQRVKLGDHCFGWSLGEVLLWVVTKRDERVQRSQLKQSNHPTGDI